ncbi:outer membrane protein assembly factor BamE domain-containing protein [Proteus vulgaris]|uniref:outer membrane protein assembly factor BamE domain-containing protein n=1 Tax=Proteus vulgaris TaxID=585 RepID=UPI0032D9F067
MILVLALCSLALSGCASSGNHSIKNETQESISYKIKKGETTKEDIVSMFGSPMATTLNSNEDEQWIYTLSDTSIKGTTFIPIYGLFDGGADTKVKQLIINFKEDKVTKYLLSDSSLETRSGILN